MSLRPEDASAVLIGIVNRVDVVKRMKTLVTTRAVMMNFEPAGLFIHILIYCENRTIAQPRCQLNGEGLRPFGFFKKLVFSRNLTLFMMEFMEFMEVA